MSSVKDLKILIVASEINPYAKSGGLGDVIGSLPKELLKLGADVRVVFPKYKNIDKNLINDMKHINSFTVSLDWRRQDANVYSVNDSPHIYMIENDYYFNREGFYGHIDDFERFAFFSKASLMLLNSIEFKPDIIHCNDWQTGLVSVYLKNHFSKLLFYKDMKTLFTIHNLQYQGVFSRETLSNADLGDEYFTDGSLEFFGNVSYMKGGLIYSDAISAVSETYAKEIQTPRFAFGMDGILQANSYKLSGIVNGIDVEKNNPETDSHIYENFDVGTVYKKSQNKAKLQEQLNLPQKDVPLISVISRLVDQKGFDLIADAMNELMNMDVQLVFLGTGDDRYEQLIKLMALRQPDKVSANICFNGDLAQKIYASSDMFLMPSLFEPCGLGQLFAMRYGTVPIVRKTGGLADTVKHYTLEGGNGFVFDDYLASGMIWALRQAVDVYKNDKFAWNKIVTTAMSCDFSWNKSAKKYIDLYLKLKDGLPG